jgi:hypothetical protein
MNDKFGRKPVTCFNALSRNLPEGTVETHENLEQKQSPDRDSNPRPFIYEAAVIISTT